MNITYQHDALNLLADALKNMDRNQAYNVREVIDGWLMDDDEKHALINLTQSIIDTIDDW